nr:integrase, catalytic region, zinc finger, CCHC-type, peptidase aspartic, catalytic [Tanacetum cinerariifolium]
MSTQQDIFAAGSENCPPMLNKENYVPWSSRLLRYAKSRPNEKLIHNSIINGPYVRQMIPEPGSDIIIQKKKAKLFNEWERFTSTDGESIESYYHCFLKLMNDFKRNKYFPERIAMLHQDQPSPSTNMQQPLPNNNVIPQPSFNQNYMQQPMPNPEDITDPTTSMNMALALMAKAFKLNYSTPTNNNQRISLNPRNRQIAQPGCLECSSESRNSECWKSKWANCCSEDCNQNLNENGNLVAARAGGNATGHNGNQIRDAAYLQTQLLIAQKEEAVIQLQAEEFDLIAAAADLDEIEEVNANYVLMANLQQASTSGTQTDKAPVYDSDRSAEVHNYDNCYDNEIFNIFTQEEQYTELLEPIPKPHQVPQNDNNASLRMTLDTYNWSSFAHQELHKIIKDEIFPIVNQVDARMKIFKIQFLKEAVKFVRDFKSLVKEADESFAKHKALELKIECLLRAVVSQDIMFVVQNNYVGDTSISKLSLNLRAQLFDEASKQKDTTRGTSVNTKFAKQSILEKPPSSFKPKLYVVTPLPRSMVFPSLLGKKSMYLTKLEQGVDNTAKTKRPQPRSNTKNDRVLSASKSSCSKNKEVEVKEHPRNLLLNKNKKHMSSECNNKQKKNVSINENQKKQTPKVKKPKNVGSNERIASPKPSKPRSFLRWSPTGRFFDLKGKIIASTASESQSDSSYGDNACTSNPLKPKIKRFPNSTSFLGRNLEGVDLLKGNRTTNLYTINLHEMSSASLICLMARATSAKSWLWHQHLSHLNFDTINDIAKNDL